MTSNDAAESPRHTLLQQACDACGWSYSGRWESRLAWWQDSSQGGTGVGTKSGLEIEPMPSMRSGAAATAGTDLRLGGLDPT